LVFILHALIGIVDVKKFSIVIPVYNEDFFISGLLESIFQVRYPSENYEVIVVSDGSTDGTVLAVKKYLSVRLIELKKNQGRYSARKIGAEAARYPDILFVDSRAVVDPNILSAINLSNEKVIVGRVLSANKPGAFETFYMSIRRKLFPSYYSHSSEIIELNKDNFDTLPKGTTVLYVQKEILFRTYEDLSHIHMGAGSSDDTKLIKAIVQHSPAIIHPDVKITGFYRTSFWESIKHLALYRGSSFVDYYLDPSLRNFWLVIVFPLLALAGIVIGSIIVPIPSLAKLMILIGLNFVVALFLAKSFREFYIILFMLPLCVSIFYFGIIRGVFLKYKTVLFATGR
jgi:glycosyltransferase involved in cell wall biosynthesis